MSISDDRLSSAGPEPPVVPPNATLAVHRFARPAGIRRLQLATVLAAAALSAALGAWVWLDDGAAVGLLVVTLALTAAMWVAWFGEPSSSVRVEYGALVVTAGEKEHRVDVAGADLRVHSTPGHRAWRVVVRRPGRRPLVVDGTMVDPVEFTGVLARWRPDVLGAGRAGRGRRRDAPDAP